MRPALVLGFSLNRVRVDVMTKPTDLDNPTERAVEASAVESEIREFVRRDAAGVRRSPETDSAPAASNIGTLVQHVAGSSIAEIDRLISELRTLRELLLSQGARVQREITKYARLNQSVVQSTKILSEALGKWKNEDAR
jgi:hypothetical protein